MLLAAGLFALGARAAESVPAAIYKDPSRPVSERVADLLSRMTLAEKVAQMRAVWLRKDLIQTPRDEFSAGKASFAFPDGLGAIARPSDRYNETYQALSPAVPPGRDARETAIYANAAQHWAVEKTRLGIPLLMHGEALHGYAARDATSFPQAIGLASSWDPDLLKQVYAVAAREMRASGVHVAFAPIADIARDPRWGRTEEAFGEDPYLVGTMAIAAVRGLQGESLPLEPEKVFAALKHLAGHGQPENGTNVGPASLSERSLREYFFPPFQRPIAELPVMAVMASYNEIDGVPSHANRWLLTDVLRTEWGFRGAVFSDYYGIDELAARHHVASSLKDAAVSAINAGVDLDLPDGEAYRYLPELVAEGKVSATQIDAAVRRILTIKFEGGLFEHPFVAVDGAEAATAPPEAIALARKAAQRSIVLLKNNRGVLPLDARKTGRLAVIGPNADYTPLGNYSDNPRHVVTVFEALKEEAQSSGAFTASYAEGVRITQSLSWREDEVKLADPALNARLIAEAVALAKNSDRVLLVLGGNEQTSREAWADRHLGDRTSLDLAGQQNELAKAIFDLGKPTVVLLLNGSPLSANMVADRADALIEGWYLGQETGHAVADVLFGRTNPGGKLPLSIARTPGQLPIFYNYKPSARRGYLFDTTKPLFPFGYGLSYTTFEIGAPRLSKSSIRSGELVHVEIDVTNTGTRAGEEAVQLYIRDEVSSVTRPVLELKRFKRVELAPGARTTVGFDLEPDDLAFWNVEMKKVVEPGAFTLFSGPDSVNLRSARLFVNTAP